MGANLTKEEAAELSGIEEVKYLDEFWDDLGDILFKTQAQKIYLDLERIQWNSPVTDAQLLAGQIGEKYPFIPVENAFGLFSKLRQVKEPEEIALIEKAIAVTKEGLEAVMKSLRPGMMEYEAEAEFDYVLKKSGVPEKAFATIAASGENATVLHYSKNASKTKENDCILFDLGAQVGLYHSDISRTCLLYTSPAPKPLSPLSTMAWILPQKDAWL